MEPGSQCTRPRHLLRPAAVRYCDPIGGSNHPNRTKGTCRTVFLSLSTPRVSWFFSAFSRALHHVGFKSTRGCTDSWRELAQFVLWKFLPSSLVNEFLGTAQVTRGQAPQGSMEALRLGYWTGAWRGFCPSGRKGGPSWVSPCSMTWPAGRKIREQMTQLARLGLKGAGTASTFVSKRHKGAFTFHNMGLGCYHLGPPVVPFFGGGFPY